MSRYTMLSKSSLQLLVVYEVLFMVYGLTTCSVEIFANWFMAELAGFEQSELATELHVCGPAKSIAAATCIHEATCMQQSS